MRDGENEAVRPPEDGHRPEGVASFLAIRLVAPRFGAHRRETSQCDIQLLVELRLVATVTLLEQLSLDAGAVDNPVIFDRGVERIAKSDGYVRLLIQEIADHDIHQDVRISKLMMQREVSRS